MSEKFDFKYIHYFSDNYIYDGYIFVEKEVHGIYLTGIINSYTWEWQIQPTELLNGITQEANFLYKIAENENYYDALLDEFINYDTFLLRKIIRTFPKQGILFFRKVNDHEISYDYNGVSGNFSIINPKTGYYIYDNNNFLLLLDLSKYEDVQDLSCFHNSSTSLIKFKTTYDDTIYIGLINLQGEFLFIEKYSSYKKWSENQIIFNDGYYDFDGYFYPLSVD